MAVPKELKYTKQHEWANVEDENALIGITDYAQEQLGDVVYVEMPEVGTTISKGEPFGVVESVKAASDIYAPLSGEVIEINESLGEHPEYVNQSPYEKGWMIKIKVSNLSELTDLMNSNEYEEFIKEEEK